MVAFILLAAICLGIWFFVFTADGRKNLTDLFGRASRVIRKEIKDRENKGF